MNKKTIILLILFIVGVLGIAFLFFNQKDGGDVEATEKREEITRKEGGNLALEKYNFYPPYKLPKSFFDKSFSNLSNAVIPRDTKIAGIIVNHHLLGSRLISRAFNSISYLNPKIIILLSPNHFNIGSAPAISSRYNWQTHYGLLENNVLIREEMISLGLIQIDENPFPEEHGISGLTSYIKYTFPDTQFIPIIFHDETQNEHIIKLSSYLAQFDIDEILVIASLDFSHDSTSEIADIRDEISIEIISSMNIERIREVEVDSRPALMLLMDYAIRQGALKFNLLDNANSAKLTNDIGITDATSYINCYFSK